MKKALILTLLAAAFCQAGEMRKIGDVVMIKNGQIEPPESAASIQQIAAIAAQSTANAAKLSLLEQAQAEAEANAEAFQQMLQAREGVLWIDSFNVLRIGEREITATNITAEIKMFTQNIGGDSTNVYHRAITFFNEDPGYDPIIRMGQSLKATNDWQTAVLIKPPYLTNIVIGATEFVNCVATEFKTPRNWSNTFFRVSSAVRGAMANQTYYPVNNGVQVKNEQPLTLIASYGTNQLRIVGGVVCTPQ